MKSLPIAIAALLILAADVSAQRTAPDARVQLVPDDIAATAYGFQEPGRHTKRGAIIGGVIGTAAGLGIGTFLALFCETESDGCAGLVLPVTLIGTVTGAVSGAIIGSAIPRGETRAAPPATGDKPRRVGSFSVEGGLATAKIEDMSGDNLFSGAGGAVQANLYAELKPWLAIGPEGGYAFFGDGGKIRHGSLAFRFTREMDRISPYLGANIGAYQTTLISTEYLGGGVSLGARINPTRNARTFVDLNARYNRHLQNIAPMQMGALSIGFGTSW